MDSARRAADVGAMLHRHPLLLHGSLRFARRAANSAAISNPNVVNTSASTTRFARRPRTEIATDMEAKVNTMLASNGAELLGFQLRSIGLLAATENKIIETLVSEQEELTETIIQQTTVVRAEKEEVRTGPNTFVYNVASANTTDAFAVRHPGRGQGPDHQLGGER